MRTTFAWEQYKELVRYLPNSIVPLIEFAATVGAISVSLCWASIESARAASIMQKLAKTSNLIRTVVFPEDSTENFFSQSFKPLPSIAIVRLICPSYGFQCRNVTISWAHTNYCYSSALAKASDFCFWIKHYTMTIEGGPEIKFQGFCSCHSFRSGDGGRKCFHKIKLSIKLALIYCLIQRSLALSIVIPPHSTWRKLNI